MQTSVQELNGLIEVKSTLPRWLGCVPGGENVKECLSFLFAQIQ